MGKTAFFLVSTPLHFLVASSIALRKRHELNAHLIFIDQQQINSHPYLTCEAGWEQSPFESRHIFAGRQKSVLEKIRSRKSIFRQLAQLVNNFEPDEVYVGNDRRVEFQFVMRQASLLKDVSGIYMDEGTFTYVGREDSGSFSDRVIDAGLKKLIYGMWWTNPPTVGASSWIREAYVAFPDLVHPLLSKKHLHTLSSEFFKDESFLSLARIIVEHFNVSADRLAGLDVLLTLPHDSVMARVPGYGERVRSLVESLSSKGRLIGVKYHPRNQQPDVLKLGELNSVWLIPDGAAYESFLPLLGKCLVVGDMSTTLLTTRWLRPELDVIAIESPGSGYFAQFRLLFQKLGIAILTPDELVLRLVKD